MKIALQKTCFQRDIWNYKEKCHLSWENISCNEKSGNQNNKISYEN